MHRALRVSDRSPDAVTPTTLLARQADRWVRRLLAARWELRRRPAASAVAATEDDELWSMRIAEAEARVAFDLAMEAFAERG